MQCREFLQDVKAWPGCIRCLSKEHRGRMTENRGWEGAMFLVGMEVQGWTQELMENEVTEGIQNVLQQIFELAAKKVSLLSNDGISLSHNQSCRPSKQ